MIQQFTVIPKDTRIFRTVFSDVSLYLPGTNDEQSHVFVKGSFDNFRTWFTPTCKDLARDTTFPDWEQAFMYETEHADLMLFKFFRLSIYCHDWKDKKSDKFLGEANCDLNTLACGPEDVTLTVDDGGVEIGFIHFNLVFREEAQVAVIPKVFHATVPYDLGQARPYNPERLHLKITKRGDGAQSLNTDNPNQKNADGGVWTTDLPAHYFGVSVTRFLEECGFDVALYESKALSSKELGHSSILFSAFMQGGDLLSEINFTVELRDAKSGDKNGELSGAIAFQGLPKYVQMYAGKNINGKVFDGKTVSGNHPMPMNIAEGGVQKASVV